MVKLVALLVLIFWFFFSEISDTKLRKVPKGISTDIEISFDTNNNSSESRLVRIIITHKVFKDAGKYWGFFWALTFMISWCLKNSKVIVCVQYANFYLRSIFFFLPFFKEGLSQYCCTRRQVMKTAFGLITEAGTKFLVQMNPLNVC